MKNRFLIVFISVMIVCSFILMKRIERSRTKTTYSIGILQTASHPALDAARDGFIEELQHTMGDDVAFIIQNAQGSISQMHAIAQQFHANNTLNGFFAIATPAAQAMSSVEKERPIFISAVTDPNALGLVYPTTNVCGSKDMIDVNAQIEMLIQLIPHAKTIGILYTAGETNSITLAKLMHSELRAHGLTPIDFAVTNESDMAAVTELAFRKSDAVLAPTDNSVASSISLIVSIANKHKKPIIVSDNMSVRFGALAARGVDYKESGRQTARIAYAVLVEGKKPYDLPIEQTEAKAIYVNKKTLDNLGLIIPDAIKNDVVLV